MTAKVNIAENPSNRPSDESGEPLRGGEPLPDFNEAGEDAFLARIVDRLYASDPQKAATKTRAEWLKLMAEIELRLDAEWLEEEDRKNPSRLLTPEENRAALKRHGLLND